MNKLPFAFAAITFAALALNAAEPEINPSHIDVYVTPYYNSKGPEISVGRFSSGLASTKEADFLTTIAEMKKEWDRLTFPSSMSLRFGFTTWAISKKRCIGFIPLSIEVGSLEFFWIRARWAASAARGLSYYRPRMPSFNRWGLTSLVTLSAI